MKNGEEEHIVVIKVTGESAKDLIAVGKKDLINYFIPKEFGLNPKDCTINMEKRVGNDKSMFGFDRYTFVD
jgi:hypothetical protein